MAGDFSELADAVRHITNEMHEGPDPRKTLLIALADRTALPYEECEMWGDWAAYEWGKIL